MVVVTVTFVSSGAGGSGAFALSPSVAGSRSGGIAVFNEFTVVEMSAEMLLASRVSRLSGPA